jgi:hypothetical protein
MSDTNQNCVIPIFQRYSQFCSNAVDGSLFGADIFREAWDLLKQKISKLFIVPLFQTIDPCNLYGVSSTKELPSIGQFSNTKSLLCLDGSMQVEGVYFWKTYGE